MLCPVLSDGDEDDQDLEDRGELDVGLNILTSWWLS